MKKLKAQSETLAVNKLIAEEIELVNPKNKKCKFRIKTDDYGYPKILMGDIDSKTKSDTLRRIEIGFSNWHKKEFYPQIKLSVSTNDKWYDINLFVTDRINNSKREVYPEIYLNHKANTRATLNVSPAISEGVLQLSNDKNQKIILTPRGTKTSFEK
jgi:hypothetical protein